MSVGIHCHKLSGRSLTESLEQTFEELKHATCAQIFTHGPHSKSQNNFDTEELKKICETRRIYTHQTYRTSWKCVTHMQELFTCADSIGAKGVVLHLARESPQYHVEVLRQLQPGRARIILEMRALKPGRYSYQEPSEINELCEALASAGFDSAKAVVCLDTAHLCAGGVKLTTREDAKRFIAELQHPEYIGLLHLNGNEYDPAKRAGDKHCTPLADCDYVFRGVGLAESGCAELVEWFIDRGCDVILEQEYTEALKKFYQDLDGLLYV